MTQRNPAILAATALLATALGVSAAHAGPTPTTATSLKAPAAANGGFVKAEGANDTTVTTGTVSAEGAHDNTGTVSAGGAHDTTVNTGIVSSEGANDLHSSQLKGSTTTSTQLKGATAPASNQFKGAATGG